jgi:hypothetical protein
MNVYLYIYSAITKLSKYQDVTKNPAFQHSLNFLIVCECQTLITQMLTKLDGY